MIPRIDVNKTLWIKLFTLSVQESTELNLIEYTWQRLKYQEKYQCITGRCQLKMLIAGDVENLWYLAYEQGEHRDSGCCKINVYSRISSDIPAARV